MPETVLAGYHKLIEVIETVFEDYTEYRYRVNDDGSIEETFKPLKLGYLPEGMEEIWRTKQLNTVDIWHMDTNDYYFNIYQKKIEKQDGTVSIVDSDVIISKELRIEDTSIMLNYENEEIYYYFLYDGYAISGITNLDEEELIKILKEFDI